MDLSMVLAPRVLLAAMRDQLSQRDARRAHEENQREAMTYIPKYADQTRCPNCRSHRIACLTEEMYDFCTKCLKLWERIPVGEHFSIDGEVMAFKVPCDNCAFRGKSPERMDPERWSELQQSLAAGSGRFYCHKGVPLDITQAGVGGGLEFEFPKKRKSVDLAGACHPYKTYDEDRMRMCRGYLNQHIAPHLSGSELSDGVNP
jgi:hypothetical protein